MTHFIKPAETTTAMTSERYLHAQLQAQIIRHLNLPTILPSSHWDT